MVLRTFAYIWLVPPATRASHHFSRPHELALALVLVVPPPPACFAILLGSTPYMVGTSKEGPCSLYGVKEIKNQKKKPQKKTLPMNEMDRGKKGDGEPFVSGGKYFLPTSFTW